MSCSVEIPWENRQNISAIRIPVQQKSSCDSLVLRHESCEDTGSVEVYGDCETLIRGVGDRSLIESIGHTTKRRKNDLNRDKKQFDYQSDSASIVLDKKNKEHSQEVKALCSLKSPSLINGETISNTCVASFANEQVDSTSLEYAQKTDHIGRVTKLCRVFTEAGLLDTRGKEGQGDHRNRPVAVEPETEDSSTTNEDAGNDIQRINTHQIAREKLHLHKEKTSGEVKKLSCDGDVERKASDIRTIKYHDIQKLDEITITKNRQFSKSSSVVNIVKTLENGIINCHKVIADEDNQKTITQYNYGVGSMKMVDMKNSDINNKGTKVVVALPKIHRSASSENSFTTEKLADSLHLKEMHQFNETNSKKHSYKSDLTMVNNSSYGIAEIIDAINNREDNKPASNNETEHLTSDKNVGDRPHFALQSSRTGKSPNIENYSKNHVVEVHQQNDGSKVNFEHLKSNGVSRNNINTDSCITSSEYCDTAASGNKDTIPHCDMNPSLSSFHNNSSRNSFSSLKSKVRSSSSCNIDTNTYPVVRSRYKHHHPIVHTKQPKPGLATHLRLSSFIVIDSRKKTSHNNDSVNEQRLANRKSIDNVSDKSNVSNSCSISSKIANDLDKNNKSVDDVCHHKHCCSRDEDLSENDASDVCPSSTPHSKYCRSVDSTYSCSDCNNCEHNERYWEESETEDSRATSIDINRWNISDGNISDGDATDPRNMSQYLDVINEINRHKYSRNGEPCSNPVNEESAVDAGTNTGRCYPLVSDVDCGFGGGRRIWACCGGGGVMPGGGGGGVVGGGGGAYAGSLATQYMDEDSSSGIRSSGGFSETSGLVGLRNIGNTCFLNSVTQCLSNTRCLLEYMVREGFSGDINTSVLSTMKGDLIRAFGSLISEMWTEGDSNRALNTGPFKTQIQRFAPTFSGYQQHDAQEFLRKLLEGLHEDVNRVTIRPKPIHTDIDDDLGDDQKAMESWKRYLRFDDSKIVDMFVGQLKSSLQCSYCSHTSVTFDPFWDLSLPIPNKSGTVKLNQCLDLFTKEEVMDGDERPTCSKCKERRKMTKSFNIQKFPKVLVLHLKRFSPTERWRGKLSCTVEFPMETLDLSRYASSSRSSSSYNLIGVANHSGTTYSGHYTAFCRHPYSAQWHEYNDSRVSPIPSRRVCSPEAYVLFYELAGASSRL